MWQLLSDESAEVCDFTLNDLVTFTLQRFTFFSVFPNVLVDFSVLYWLSYRRTATTRT